MALTAGDRLDRYEITSLLGTGGMREVYFAEDTRLDRKVTQYDTLDRDSLLVRWMPDGRAIAYIRTVGGVPNSWIQRTAYKAEVCTRSQSGHCATNWTLRDAVGQDFGDILKCELLACGVHSQE